VFALHAVRAMLETNDVASASSLVTEVRDRLTQGADELRRVVRGLRPAALDTCGLVAAVRAMCDELTLTRNIRTEFEAKGCDWLPEEAEHLAYRVIQQALANAGTHAGARNIRVRVVKGVRALEAEVVDDGRGFDPGLAEEFARQGRVGLASMQERAQLAGAALWIWSRPGAGTTIRLRVPLG
jgi:two-component system sensor histidine kinase UhpB